MIVSTLTSGWGDQARGSNRYFAFDKRDGPSSGSARRRPSTTTPTTRRPIVLTADGRRLLIVGGSDGTFHALEAATGRPVWSLELSKRAHPHERELPRHDRVPHPQRGEPRHQRDGHDRRARRRRRAARSRRTRSPGARYGFQGGFASPVIDAERLYQVDNGAMLGAFELATGTQALGEAARHDPEGLAGARRRQALRRHRERQVLHPQADGRPGPRSSTRTSSAPRRSPEAIIASPAVARGRVYLASMDALYAIGHEGRARGRRRRPPSPTPRRARRRRAGGGAARSHRGARQAGRDACATTCGSSTTSGRFVREEPARELDARGPEGRRRRRRPSPPPPTPAGRPASSRRPPGTLTATARVRVAPPLPWSFDFEGGTARRRRRAGSTRPASSSCASTAAAARSMKRNDIPLTKRGRAVLRARPTLTTTPSRPTCCATEKRRQMGDVGIIAQRYTLVLFGNRQKLELHPWQAEPRAHRRACRSPGSPTPGTA